MIDLMRVDACPRCQRGFPDGPKLDDPDCVECPVCEGKPVVVLVLWRHYLNASRGQQDATKLVASAAAMTADVLVRPEGARGEVFRGDGGHA